MVSRIFKYFFIYLVCLVSIIGKANNLSDDKLRQIRSIRESFDVYHINPDFRSKALQKDLSFQILTVHLDPLKIYFNQNEIDTLREAFDTYATETDLDSLTHFLEFTKNLHLICVSRASDIINELSYDDLNLDKEDTLWLSNPFKKISPINDKELKRNIRIVIKARFLGLWNYMDSTANSDLFSKVIDKESCWLSSKTEELNTPDYYFNLYLKTVAESYDPHSTHMTQMEMEQFSQSLSKSTLNFGFDVVKNSSGNLEIESIIPGGAAWKSGEIKVGDEIWQITDNIGDNHFVNCMSMIQIRQVLDEPSNRKITFLIRKEGGGSKMVTLTKYRSENFENLVNIYLLKGEYNIGYCALPSFYVDDQSLNLFGSTNDVTKAILKVKNDNLDGLILDLRDNGGGSLSEAIGLASVFLNTGPVLIKNERNENPILFKDLNRGSIFTGPMVVLVNEYSASASEILAAALQDNHRALIVGNPTFGKATGQEIIILKEDKPEWGFVKITTGYLHRFPGNSYQKAGVIPDISLGESQYRFVFRESDFLNPLEVGYVNKKIYFEPPKELPVENILESHKKRMEEYTTESASQEYLIISFNKMKEVYRSLGQREKHSEDVFQVENSSYDTQIIDALETNKIIDQREKEAIESDWQLCESYHIISDLIQELNK